MRPGIGFVNLTAMKYTVEVTIEASRDRVVAAFDDPANLKHWMPGLLSFEPISGTPGQVGAKARLKFDMGGRQMEMIETITERNLPETFSGTYDANGVHNIVRNRFEPVGEKQTRWVAENEFIFAGFMMKVMGWLMPGVFRKQSLKYLEAFKAFVETGQPAAG